MKLFCQIILLVLTFQYCLAGYALSDYKYTKDRMNFDAAVNYCKERNMDLVRIDNAETNNLIYNLALNNALGSYWINGNDIAGESDWRDTGFKLIPFRHWHTVTPNGGRGENCIHGLYFTDGLWNDISCQSHNSVICEPSQGGRTDPQFIYTKDKMNFESAVNYCKGRNLELIKIDNSRINNLVYDFALKNGLGWYWINANDIAAESEWINSGHKLVPFRNWHPVEPNGGRNENCAHGLYYIDALWNDINCNVQLSVICGPAWDYEDSSQSSNSQGNKDNSQGNKDNSQGNKDNSQGNKDNSQQYKMEYYMTSEKMTYDAAVNFCKDKKMDLVIIYNAEINTYIYNFASSNKAGTYWINGNDNEQEDRWVDTNNKLLPYKNWQSGEPNGQRSENCIHGARYPDGFWNDISCTSENAVICQKGNYP